MNCDPVSAFKHIKIFRQHIMEDILQYGHEIV